MQRRQFLATACATGLVATSIETLQAAESSSAKPQLLDLKMMTTPNAQRKEALIKHIGESLIPTLNKYGVSPVGLFVANSELNSQEQAKKDQAKKKGKKKKDAWEKEWDNVVFGIVPHASFESMVELMVKLQKDAQYSESAAALAKGTSSKDPLYTDMDRMLLRCFPELPEIRVPTLSPDRVVQLRMYRSHNDERNQAKANMFAQGGEIALFEKCGLNPVFFTTMLYGSFMPSVVYMLSFENDEHRKDAWAKFQAHPEWQKIRSNPIYKDTATRIINLFLKPCPGSQI